MGLGNDSNIRLGTVEGKIRQVVTSLGPEVSYLFCNWTQANVEIDQIQSPTIVYVLPPSGNLSFSWNEVKDFPEAQIAFLSNTEFDFDGSENDNIIEQMKRLCIRFIKSINESNLFEQIEGNVPYKVLYDHLDQNVTGIVITLKLEEIDGVEICEEEVR